LAFNFNLYRYSVGTFTPKRKENRDDFKFWETFGHSELDYEDGVSEETPISVREFSKAVALRPWHPSATVGLAVQVECTQLTHSLTSECMQL
jgi:hypothetical protein